MADDQIPSWVAAGLPERFLAEGYRRTGANAVQSTEMAAGNFKTRLKSLMAPEPVQGVIFADTFRLARFWTFYNVTTKKGSEPFWTPDQVFDGAPLMTAAGRPITTRAGVPILRRSRWLVIFAPDSPPQESDREGAGYLVNFNLLILP